MAAYVQALYLARISTVVSLAGPSMEPTPLRIASALHGSLVNDSIFAFGETSPFRGIARFSLHTNACNGDEAGLREYY